MAGKVSVWALGRQANGSSSACSPAGLPVRGGRLPHGLRLGGLPSGAVGGRPRLRGLGGGRPGLGGLGPARVAGGLRRRGGGQPGRVARRWPVGLIVQLPVRLGRRRPAVVAVGGSQPLPSSSAGHAASGGAGTRKLPVSLALGSRASGAASRASGARLSGPRPAVLRWRAAAGPGPARLAGLGAAPARPAAGVRRRACRRAAAGRHRRRRSPTAGRLPRRSPPGRRAR